MNERHESNKPRAASAEVRGIPRLIYRLDLWQRHHRLASFVYAVAKKFGDDNGGYQAALITYYGFLSLFPLLLVLVTLLQILFHNHASVRYDVLASVTNFFPLLGNQIQSNVHGLGKTGVGLAVGLLLTFYGARGAADALRYMLDNVWQVPKTRRPGFPQSMLQSLGIMLSAGVGFVATVAVSSFSSALGHAMWVKLIANVLGFIVLGGTFLLIVRVATFRQVPVRAIVRGAFIAAGIIQMLLTFGAVLVAHQLKHLDSVYGTFAIVLGLLFWIYLISQVFVYAAELDSVRYFRLWPRAIMGNNPTDADHRAYELYANVQRFVPHEANDLPPQ